MTFESYKCLVINHYDGSTVEAYRLSYGDSYRLQLRESRGQWTWKFSNNKDDKFYASRESALIGCVSYLFRRILQLSAVMELDDLERSVNKDGIQMAYEKWLPTRFRSVDSLELHGKHMDFIDILESENKFYAFYSDSTFSGPYPSHNQALRDVVFRFSSYSDELLGCINKINCIIQCINL